MARNWDEFRAALRRLPAPGSNSYMPTSMATSDIRPSDCFRSAGTTTATCQRSERPANRNGKASSLSTNYRPPSIHRRACIVTANQNPFPPTYPYRVGGEFAPHYREQQIRSLLAKRGTFKPEDMLAIQKDVYSSLMKFIAQQTVSAYDKRNAKNASLQSAVELLRKWDGQMDQDEAAPLVAVACVSAPANSRGQSRINGQSGVVGFLHGRADR